MTRPRRVRLAVFIDDASVDGKARHFGFGTLWMPWQRRGDFSREIRNLRETHGYSSEIKWTKVKGHSISFYEDLVDWFFRTRWLAFHCIVVHRADLKMELHNHRIETARMKAVTRLLTNKVHRILQKHARREVEFRVYVDPLPSSYARADEAMQVISNHIVRNASGKTKAIAELRTRDSSTDPGIQLCDLLLGAVMDAFNGRSSSAHKARLGRHVASMLDWPDLQADTVPEEKKFNIWYLWDCKGQRPLESRPVRLKFGLSS